MNTKKILKVLIILLLMFSMSLVVFSIWYLGVWEGSVDKLVYLLTHPIIFVEKTNNWVENFILEVKIAHFLKNKEIPNSELNPVASRRLEEVNSQPFQPILIIIDDENAENKFGRFLGEILLAEGFNEFQMATLSNVTPDVLKSFDLVILTQAKLTGSQLTNFEQHVANGGSLLALKPDKKLASLCGLISTT